MSTDRIAVVTGVGRAAGIAHGIATRLAADGWRLALVTAPIYDRDAELGGDPADIERLMTQVEALGARPLLLDADLADAAAPAAIMARTVAELGIPHALVLSHSHSVDSSILTTSVESFDRHHAINARAAWLLIRALAEVTPTDARIVALTSDHVVHNLAYGTSKGALDRIVIAAAGELGSRGYTANLVNPGPVDTGWMSDEIRQSMRARQRTGRLGTPADIAELVSFLVSDAGAWTTGQLIKSDGGFSISW